MTNETPEHAECPGLFIVVEGNSCEKQFHRKRETKELKLCGNISDKKKDKGQLTVKYEAYILLANGR